MRTFLWLVKYDRIICNVERKWRGFTICDRRYCCGWAKEDVNHIFRKCRKVEETWRTLKPGITSDNRWRGDFQKWLDQNVAGNGPETKLGDWSTVFTVLVWWLWKWRNDEVLNQKKWSLGQKMDWIKQQCKEIGRDFNNATQPSGWNRRSEVQKLRWIKLLVGWEKLNTNGWIVRNTSAAGSRGVI